MSALTHLEPGTISQPRVKPNAKPKPRKPRNAKPGSARILQQPRPGLHFQIFNSNNQMEEVTKKTRYQSAEQKRRTVFVRKHGACPECHKAHRAVRTIPSNITHLLIDHQCVHVPEELTSAATSAPMTPD